MHHGFLTVPRLPRDFLPQFNSCDYWVYLLTTCERVEVAEVGVVGRGLRAGERVLSAWKRRAERVGGMMAAAALGWDLGKKVEGLRIAMERARLVRLSSDQPRPAPCYSRHQFHFLSDSSPTLPPPSSHQLASPRPTSRTDNTPLLPANQADNSTWPQAHR